MKKSSTDANTDASIDVLQQKKAEGIKNRQLMRRSTFIILPGVAIMVALSIYIIGLSPSLKETLDADRPVARKTIVHLSVFEFKDKNKISIQSEVSQTKLVFDLSSNVPIHVALLSSVNSMAPEILFQGAKIPPGQHKRLGKAGDRFIYKTSAGQGEIKFCLVQAENASNLVKKLLRPKNIWSRIPDTQCVNVTVI